MQLAGLFFDLLQSGKMEKFGTHLQQLKSATEEFISLEQSLRTKESELKQQRQEMSVPDHAFFQKLREVLRLEFPVFLRTTEDLESLLSHVGFTEPLDVPELPEWNDSMRTFKNPETLEYFAVSSSIFQADGALFLPRSWDDGHLWRGKNFKGQARGGHPKRATVHGDRHLKTGQLE